MSNLINDELVDDLLRWCLSHNVVPDQCKNDGEKVWIEQEAKGGTLRIYMPANLAACWQLFKPLPPKKEKLSTE